MYLELDKDQKRYVDHLVSKKSAALFVSMGLGKTAATLEAINILIGSCVINKALVIAPLYPSMSTWENEIKKWDRFKHLKYKNLRQSNSWHEFSNGSYDVYTLNYEMLPSVMPKLFPKKHKEQGALVVFDELDYAKNWSSIRIKAFNKYRNQFSIFWGLTGTPIGNSYLDLFAQIRLLDGGASLGKSITKYIKTFFIPDYTGYKFNIKEGASKIISNKIKHICMTNTNKFNPPNVKDINIEMPERTKKIYRELEKDLISNIEGNDYSVINAAALVGKLAQITGGNLYEKSNCPEGNYILLHNEKLKALKKIINRHKEPILIATNFKHEQKEIIKVFKAEKFKKDTLDKWNSGEIPLLVSHPSSISHGLNLQEGGRIIVWYSLTYSKIKYDQFNARLHRRGQKKEVIIYRLMVDQSIDWDMAESIASKKKISDEFSNLIGNIKRRLTN